MTDAEIKDAASADLEQVPAVEVQKRVSELLNRASFGKERIVLTRHGKATAALVSMDDLERLRALDAEKVRDDAA